MRLQWKWGVAMLAIGVGCLFALRAYTQQSPQPALANADTIFQSIRPALMQKGVPLRLPTYIPAHGQRPTAPNYTPPPVQASVPETQPDRGYLAVLGYSPGCDGGNACRFGSVSGVAKPAVSIEDSYREVLKPKEAVAIEDHRSDEPMARVKLANGIEGWFIPWVCQNTCTDAQVVWDEYAYRYSVGVKLGDRISLVKMADSAIEAGNK